MSEQEAPHYLEWLRLESRGLVLCEFYAAKEPAPRMRYKWKLLLKLEHATRQAIVDRMRIKHVRLPESVLDNPSGPHSSLKGCNTFHDVLRSVGERIDVHVPVLAVAARRASGTSTFSLALRIYEHELALSQFIKLELLGKHSAEPILNHLRSWESRV